MMKISGVSESAIALVGMEGAMVSKDHITDFGVWTRIVYRDSLDTARHSQRTEAEDAIPLIHTLSISMV
tara:strand:+ start:741 stop:947 length:207 start_codon:yes stop_codon:yes gene_type:complete